jgi:predicted TIM-barrel fold metal-dependent hydrolase
MDISSSLMFMSQEKAVELINRYGAERLVYGTDFPLWDPLVEVPRFLDLPLTLQQQEQIAYKTAESIFQDQILL